jgi:glycosyltransferase involved in cell wall biosynthesis
MLTERQLRKFQTMNILIFSKHFWPESFRINELAQDLRDEGEHVSVLTGKPNYPAGDIFPGYTARGTQTESFDGITVRRVPLIPRGKSGARGLLANYVFFNLSSMFYAPFLLRKEKIDVIFVYGTSPLIQGLSALPLKVLFKAKLVVWVQDLWPEDLVTTGYVKNPVVLKINEWAARVLYRFSDQILIQSERFRLPVTRLAPKKEILFLPNAAERSVFAKCDLPALPGSLEFLKTGFNIVFAGNIGNNQSIETIVSAAEILKKDRPGIRIVMVGSGSLSGYLKEEVEKRGLSNLIIAGRYPSDTMPAVFAHSHGLLVSLAKKDSLSWTVPSKVQAYLAAGKPIVAALDGEGAAIVRESGAGVVCPTEDAQGLAACIVELFEMSDGQRQEMGSKGRLYAEEHYHPKKIARQLISYFSALTEARGQ